MKIAVNSLSVAILLAMLTMPLQAQLVTFRLAFHEDVVRVGDLVAVDLFVQDSRPNASGILSAYVDLTYTGQLLELVPDSLRFGPEFGSIPSYGVARASSIDELGSFVDGTVRLPPSPMHIAQDESLFASMSFRALAVGEAQISSDPADILPLHATTLFGRDDAVSSADISFDTAHLTIVPEPAGLHAFALLALGAGMLWRRR